MRGLIIWHYYKDDKLVNSSATIFKGTEDQLQERIRQNYDESRDAYEKGETIGIFHNFILFERD